jgi:type III secretory pathway component EscU
MYPSQHASCIFSLFVVAVGVVDVDGVLLSSRLVVVFVMEVVVMMIVICDVHEQYGTLFVADTYINNNNIIKVVQGSVDLESSRTSSQSGPGEYRM